MPPKHRRGHSAIFNTAVTPTIPAFQANVQDYDPVTQDDEEPAEKPAPTQAEIDFDEALHAQGGCARCAGRGRYGGATKRPLPWMVATGVLAVLCLWLFMSQPAPPAAAQKPSTTPIPAPAPPKGADKEAQKAKPSNPELGSSEAGFWNELAAARPSIKIEKVQFSGSPVFTSDGKGTVPPAPGKKSYVGKPSKELDAAWDELVHDRHFLLTDEEAEAAWGKDYQRWWVNNHGGYLAGVGALHSLNCLNHLRQALDPDYYSHPRLTVAGMEWHHDHCVDHLRQLIMCHGDLTPIPSRYVSGIHQNYVATDLQHTCRNFDAIQTYVKERTSGSLKVPERNQTLKGPNEWEKAKGGQ